MRGPLYGPEERDLGYEVIPMKEVKIIGNDSVMKRVHASVGNRPVFDTYDIDFLDPAYAPVTGTLEVGGPTSYEGHYL